MIHRSSPADFHRVPSSVTPLRVGVHEVIVKPIGAPRKCADGSRMRVQYVNRFSIARSVLGWSQDKAALKLGCSRRWVIDFEHGRVALTEEAMTFTSWLEEQALERTGT
jgi:ribosome-binding protein aMBF1 (putative translation factor)